MTAALIILVVLLTLAHFYLKCSMMTSFSTMLAALFAMIIAFTYYERLAELFVSRGYGVDWAHFGCFILAFVLGFALMRALADLLVGAQIDLGKPVKTIAAVCCGLVTGLIISGNLLVALGMLPMQGKVFYSRFEPERAVIPKKPNLPFINADGFVVGLYNWVSAGSMRSGKSFATLHAEYLSQIHINKLNVEKKVITTGSRQSLTLPPGKKNAVRIWELPDRGKVMVVRMGIVAKSIPDGGANNSSGKLEYFPGQLRMVSKKASEAGNIDGFARADWPIGLIENGRFVEWELEQIRVPKPDPKDRIAWKDVVFEIPQGYEGVLLQFKQNAVVPLPKAVPTSDEIEQSLQKAEEEEKAGQ